MTINRRIDIERAAYRLATAIYIVAKHEAAGVLSHHPDKTVAELEEIQQQAYEFCQEWRQFFADRLRSEAAPLPPPGEIRYHPNLNREQPSNEGKYRKIDAVYDHLLAHGPATVREIVEAIGAGYDSTRKLLHTHPELFRKSGKRKGWQQTSTLWAARPSKGNRNEH